jgi:hypothetical protein
MNQWREQHELREKSLGFPAAHAAQPVTDPAERASLGFREPWADPTATMI